MKRFDRGNAVPETALTVTFTLLILFGIVQLTTTAFYQVSADGAAFVGSHDTVASLGSPTSANKSTTVSAAQGAFEKIVAGSVNVINPSSSTFETDVLQQVPGISALGNPQQLTISSRDIEESAGTASASNSALLNCTSAATDIVNGATAGTSTATQGVLPSPLPTGALPIGLVQAGSLLTTTTVGTTSTLTLGTGPLTTQLGLITTVQTNLSSTVAALSALPNALSSIPLLGPTLLAPIEAGIGPALTSIVDTALTQGTFNATSALAAVDGPLAKIPGVGTLLTTAINATLTGGVSGTGLLGANGPLAALAKAEAALDAVDAKATSNCPAGT